MPLFKETVGCLAQIAAIYPPLAVGAKALGEFIFTGSSHFITPEVLQSLLIYELVVVPVAYLGIKPLKRIISQAKNRVKSN